MYSSRAARDMDLLHGPIFPKILSFVLPLMLTNLLQSLYNAADMIIVGLSNVSGAIGLMGKALYLVATGDTTVVQLRRYTTMTISTSEGKHDIAGVGEVGGGFSLDKYSAVAGETVTYTATPSTGYSAIAPTTSPALTMTSLGNNKWSFVMPNSDVIVYAHFSNGICNHLNTFTEQIPALCWLLCRGTFQKMVCFFQYSDMF